MVQPPSGPLTPPRFIYITGCDGVGKTTQARLLVEQLRARGLRVRRVWLRFPFFFSLPLLAYARLRGYSWHEQAGPVRHGYWHFRPSRLLRLLFPWALLLDASLAALFRIHLPLRAGWTIVCERFVLDMLVDQMVAFGEDCLPARLPGRLYLRLLPSGAKVILLDLSPARIQARRQDLQSDRLLAQRQQSFLALGAACGLPRLSTEDSITRVNRRIWDLLSA